jgi:hypothetical protein
MMKLKGKNINQEKWQNMIDINLGEPVKLMT